MDSRVGDRGAPANDDGAPPGRHNRRVALQRRQREENREKIVQAALLCLTDIPYAALAVEDIIRRAGVSRATFYKHFDSKLSVVRALHPQFLDRLYAIFDALCPGGDTGEEGIAQWIETMTEFYRRERVLTKAFAHMEAIEPAFLAPVHEIAIEVTRRCGLRLPAFRAALTSGRMATPPQIELHFLLRAVNYFSLEVAHGTTDIDSQEGAMVLARQFRRFLETYGD